MTRKDMLIGLSGIIAAVVARIVIRSIGIENISLETKLFIMYILVVVYSIKSTKEKNKIARKYLIVSSIMFVIIAALLSVFLILEEGLLQVFQIIRLQLITVIVVLFVSILIPVYAAYFEKQK